MYIILCGKHPLYEHGEGMASYCAKLKDPQWKFPADFSQLAQHFFLRMTRTNPLDRYTAKDALMHPWVTRQPSPIPLTYLETTSLEQAKKKFKSV
jgi:serine/threonine protein kinase